MKKLLLSMTLMLSVGSICGMYGVAQPKLTAAQQEELTDLMNKKQWTGLTSQEQLRLNMLISWSQGIRK